MQHTYNVHVVQKYGGKDGIEGRIGILKHPTNSNFHEITIQSPSEFQGPKDDQDNSLYWTPEDLFVSSVAICLYTTFVSMAEKMHLEYKGMVVDAQGLLEKHPDVGLMITKIHQKATVIVSSEDWKEKAVKALEKAEKYCLIANSIRTEVTMEPIIKIEPNS